MVGALLKVSAVVPRFLTVTANALLVATVPKASEAGDRLTWVPVPFSDTACGEPLALSATSSAAVSAPVAAGLKVTEIVQLALAANVVPQVVVSVKEEASTPPIVIPPVLISRVAAPVFFSVTTWTALDDPTLVVGKVRAVGVRETVGTT